MTVRRINLDDARLRRLARDLRLALEEQQEREHVEEDNALTAVEVDR